MVVNILYFNPGGGHVDVLLLSFKTFYIYIKTLYL